MSWVKSRQVVQPPRMTPLYSSVPSWTASAVCAQPLPLPILASASAGQDGPDTRLVLRRSHLALIEEDGRSRIAFHLHRASGEDCTSTASDFVFRFVDFLDQRCKCRRHIRSLRECVSGENRKSRRSRATTQPARTMIIGSNSLWFLVPCDPR